MNRLIRDNKAMTATTFPKEFADWREIPSQALERRELRDALTQGSRLSPGEIPRRYWFCAM